MDFFDWDSRYDIGVDAMNTEHRRLIHLMNRLHTSDRAAAPRAEIAMQLKELADYTLFHFGREEVYMAALEFDELTAHQRIHADLLEKLAGHVEEFERTGELSDSFFSFLKRWLAAHICGTDRKYGAVAVAKAG